MLSDNDSSIIEDWRFGGGASETILHPLVLAAMIAAIAALLWLPRRYRLVAFVFSAFLIPAGQQFVAAGVHIFVYRVIVIAGLVGSYKRFGSPNNNRLAGGWNTIDTAFVSCILAHVAAYTLLYRNSAAIVNQIGYAWDYLGGYLLLRQLIQSKRDIVNAVRCMAWLAAIFAACMIREQISGQNIFGLLGGVRLISQVREGDIRSEAVFQHAITAGAFGATAVPLFVWLWKTRTYRVVSMVGVIGSGVMVYTSRASTPVGALCAGVVAICFWPFRRHMKWLRWTLAITLVFLHIVMNGPVWALIARASVLGGSSAHHRYELVDQFIRHVEDWWLLGTASNANWGTEMVDTSNAFVQEGEMGGLLTLMCFILVISTSFRRVGLGIRRVSAVHRSNNEWLFWALGASVFAHVVAFFGIYYFDQTRVAWFVLLALISAASSEAFFEKEGHKLKQGTIGAHEMAAQTLG